MTITEVLQLGGLVVQFSGVLVSFLVVGNKILTLVRDWREGPPELRTIRDQIASNNDLLRDSNNQLKSNNDRIYSLLERAMYRLDEGR